MRNAAVLILVTAPLTYTLNLKLAASHIRGSRTTHGFGDWRFRERHGLEIERPLPILQRCAYMTAVALSRD